MSIAAPFIRRPVATTLLTIGLALAGGVAFFLLPVSPLPNVDLPTIVVSASLPGASPETVATSVTTPLERHLGTIAGVTEMTSQSAVGSSSVVLQFDLSRNIDGAARDVEAAIQAARIDLPSALRSNPGYRKLNPSDAPVMILALTSDTLTAGQIYDSASTILQQKLLQVQGVGDVTIGGSSLPAVRVELNPRTLFKYGIGLEDVRAALSAANANSPKGAVDFGNERYQIYVNDTATRAAQYQSLVVAYRNNAAVRLQDVATVSDAVENIRNLGLADGKPAVLLVLHRQPGANVIDVVNSIRALIPELQASIPASIRIIQTNDRTETIRASLRDVERTLLIAIVLVVLVVFLTLRNARAALVPSVAVPLSLIGTFGAMYLLGFSLDNLSLMALTVATGFVVDDAIVVLENISRHVEEGMSRFQAAIQGAREVGFTVLAMSLSLIAVFLPILLMGGIVGRTFREFALTLSIAILISLVVSLTTTPMMCAQVLRRDRAPQGRFMNAMERGFDAMRDFYGRTLAVALEHPRTVMIVLGATVALNFYLYSVIPKGFFPQQDTGTLTGNLRADQSISFQAMARKLRSVMSIVQADPAVQDVVGFTGGGGGGPGGGGGATNTANIFVGLKPLSERKLSSDRIIARLRLKLANITGVRLYLQAIQDIRAGGRQSNSQYQYTILSDDLSELFLWTPRITEALKTVPEIADVNSDRQDNGLDIALNIDRSTAARLGINLTEVDNTLYDAFGQRQVSTIYNDMNQYHVVMEVDPSFWQSPETLKEVWVSTSGGALSGTQSSAGAVSDFAAATTTGTATASTASLSSASSACTSTTSSSTGSSSNVSPTPSSAAVTSAGAATGAATTSSTASASCTSASNLAQAPLAAEQNLALNQLTNSGRGGASTGASIATASETTVPLAAFSSYGPNTTPLAINHQGPFVATTFSFNLPEGESLSTAIRAIQRTMQQIHVPISVHGTFAGTARVFQQSLANEPWLIAAAIIAVYIVLGILYESYVHPITILSTLPSAGVGAVLALLLFGTEFSLIALIGVILLIGIVKKNAIMMIDVALETERSRQVDARTAIYDACLLRFRPIMMTTFAALLGAIPLAVTTGSGAEMRQPLGISIVGGLIFSQVLTLYTTPVVYIYLDRFRLWLRRLTHRRNRGALIGGDPQQQPT
ncbi:MAG TPA: efflux RND transporter permease subunit [Steroidobacteraceae bacterium]|nr:efflux RND transporter permease subunit [Steroidobacteraceae bacterium]